VAGRGRIGAGPPARAQRTRRRSRTVASALAITLAIAFSIPGFVLPTSSAERRSSAELSAPAVLGGAGSLFAERAGYSPHYAAEVADAGPATGAVPIVVTFAAPLPPAAYADTLSYFRSAGLRPTTQPADRITLGLTGPAAGVDTAFGTRLMAGTLDGTPVLFPATPPSVPAELSREVAGVVGLSEGFTRFSFDLAPLAPSPSAQPGANPSDTNTVTPDLARQFYDLGSLTDLGGSEAYPTGLSIAVVLWGNGPSPADLSAFFNDSSLYPSSLPKPTIHSYNVAGAPPPSDNAPFLPNALSVEELTLDTEWAASMAPGATIDIVYAPNGPAPTYSPSTAALTVAVQKAVALDPAVISMSFGAPESSAGTLISDWTPLFTAAARNNTTILAATGDTGGDSTFNSSVCSGIPSPEFPSSDPQVLAVGGTNVSVHLGVGDGYSESGWSGSGGGFSDRFSAPTWQSGTVSTVRANGHRGMPDVSASAADDYLFFNSTSQMARGTSFATPLWAGLVADIDAKWGHRLGFFTPSLYHVGSVEGTGGIGSGLADITSGGNCVARTATAGWDAVTGWGSPHAAVLYDDLLGSFVTIDLHLGSTAVGPGGSVSVSAQVTNRTTGVPISGVPVNLSISADTVLGPCTGGRGGVFGSQFPETDAQGWVYGTLSVPVCYLGQHALVNASVTTPKYYGTSGDRVGVNLLGFIPQLEFLSASPYAYFTYAVILGVACIVGVWLGRPRETALPPPRRRSIPPPSPPTASAPPPPTPPSGPAPEPPKEALDLPPPAQAGPVVEPPPSPPPGGTS
jgi:kumamolisin